MSGPFKMKGYSYPGISPFKKDIKMYNGSGKQVTVDDSKLGEWERDDDGNEYREHESGELLYKSKHIRFGGPIEPKNPDPPSRLLA